MGRRQERWHQNAAGQVAVGRSRGTAIFDLRRLIDPIDPETFKRQYWEKRPLVVRRGRPDYYRGLLSLPDVDRALSISSIWSSQIRVLRDGNDIPPAQLGKDGLLGSATDLESLYAHYRGGATIVLQFLHERWKPLMDLCRVLASEFSASLQVNAYLTPARERALDTHYDTHDVFVLQAAGSKHWRLYEGDPVRLPLKGQPCDSKAMKPGALLEEFDLHPGDLIYIPRGCMHDAVSRDSTSLHLTVGVSTITWAAVILRAVESVIERDPRFRESLPAGFARSDSLGKLATTRLTALLNALLAEIEPASMVGDARQEAALYGHPALDGHFLDLEGLPRVGLQTRVRRRANVEYTFTTAGGRATLHFHGKSVQMPAYTEPYLRFIFEAAEFRAADLPGGLDDEGKLVLVRTLIREGFLTTGLRSERARSTGRGARPPRRPRAQGVRANPP